MIPDGHVLVIGKQRTVRPKELADVRRVIDRSEEVRVVADRGWWKHLSFRHRNEGARWQRVDHDVVTRLAGEQLAKARAKRGQRIARGLHQFVERRTIAPPRHVARLSAPQVRAQGLADVDDLISDCHSDATLRIPFAREDAKGEILNRKIGVGGVRGFYPRRKRWVVRLVHWTVDLALRVRWASSSMGSRKEHEPKEMANRDRDARICSVLTRLPRQTMPPSSNPNAAGSLSSSSASAVTSFSPAY